MVETLTRRRVDICGIQEVRWRGGSARLLTGMNSRYKLYWMGNQAGTGGVGILLAEKWIDKVFDIARVSDRILVMKICIDKVILNIISVYDTQSGLDSSDKDAFYNDLHSVVSRISSQEKLFICGDFNGHIGCAAEANAIRRA